MIDVQGVGYEVFIASSVHAQLPEPHCSVVLYIYTHVREDQIHLFGFLTRSQKELFELMLSVSGIGPKLALNMLSEITPGEFIQFILTDNIQRISSMKGIGKKTAERLVLELKSKIKKYSENEGLMIDMGSSGKHFQDLISALANLGYKQNEIDRTVSHFRQTSQDNASFEIMLRQALQYLRV